MTCGLFVILGSTYTGAFESVKAVADKLDEYEKKTGIDIPIHVDAASGGFVAPFVYPDLLWDFRVPRVHSINASGHKYGMSTVGVGWCIWRSDVYLPKDIIFELHYLGETDYSFNLNFSRPAHPILGQMFNCKCPRAQECWSGWAMRNPEKWPECHKDRRGTPPSAHTLFHPLAPLLHCVSIANTQSSTSASAGTAA